MKINRLFLSVIALSFLLICLCGCGEQPAAGEEAQSRSSSEEHYWGILAMDGITEEEFTQLLYDWDQQDGMESWNGTPAGSWHCRFYNDITTAMLALQKGDSEEFDSAAPCIEYLMAQNPGVYQLKEFASNRRLGLAMAVLEENTELLNTLDAAIAALQENGTVDALAEEYIKDCGSKLLPQAVNIPPVKDGETIRVLVTGDLPPMDYVNTMGTAAGYNIAMLSAISQQTGLNIELVYGDSGSRYMALSSGKADVVFCAKGISRDNNEEIDFSMDLPEGVSVTRCYNIQDYQTICMAEAQ